MNAVGMSGPLGGNVWAQHAGEFHLVVGELADMRVDVACIEAPISSNSFYHCDAKAGQLATPAIGTTCGICRAAMEDTADVE